MNNLARHAEQVASDAAYTRCLAEEIRLRRLVAELVKIEDETLGVLSPAEQLILAKQILKGEV